MNGRKSEIPHNSDEQVREYVAKALALVDDLDPPSDLRVAAFAKAMELYASKQVMIEAIQPGIGGLAIPRG